MSILKWFRKPKHATVKQMREMNPNRDMVRCPCGEWYDKTVRHGVERHAPHERNSYR